MKKKSTEVDTLYISVTGHRFIPDDHRLEEAIKTVLGNIFKKQEGKSAILYSAMAECAFPLVTDNREERFTAYCV